MIPCDTQVSFLLCRQWLRNLDQIIVCIWFYWGTIAWGISYTFQIINCPSNIWYCVIFPMLDLRNTHMAAYRICLGVMNLNNYKIRFLNFIALDSKLEIDFASDFIMVCTNQIKLAEKWYQALQSVIDNAIWQDILVRYKWVSIRHICLLIVCYIAVARQWIFSFISF